MNLAIATLELCIDDKDYEKAQQIFKEYANQRRFQERVVSGEEIKSAKWAKELPKQINYRFLHKVSVSKFNYSKFSESAERKLFEGFIYRLKVIHMGYIVLNQMT